MNNKSVLLISPLPPPIGGIASWTVNVLHYLNRNVSGVSFIHYNSSSIKHTVTNKVLLYSLLNTVTLLVKVVLICIRTRPGLIHLNSSAGMGVIRDYVVIMISKLFKIKVVIHYHFGGVPELKEKNNWEWKILIASVKKSHKCIVLDVRSLSVLNLNECRNVIFLPNPILSTNNCFGSKISKREEGAILFVGNIVSEKGVFELIEACANISSVNKVTLVGPFSEEVKFDLLRLPRLNNMEIVFKGTLKKDFVLEEMRKCTLFVLPSHSEGFPYVILEAMSVGCPIISTKVGGIPEMLENNAGICINPKDVKELQLTIHNLIINNEDRNVLGENAKKSVIEKYSIDKVAKELLQVWDFYTF